MNKSEIVDYIMSLDGDSLDSLNRESCIEAQYFLQLKAIEVNNSLKDIKSKHLVNVVIFNRAIAKHYASYDPYLGKDLIIASICNEYEYVGKMQDTITEAVSLLENIESYIIRLDKITQIIKDLSFCKRKEF